MCSNESKCGFGGVSISSAMLKHGALKSFLALPLFDLIWGLVTVLLEHKLGDDRYTMSNTVFVLINGSSNKYKQLVSQNELSVPQCLSCFHPQSQRL